MAYTLGLSLVSLFMTTALLGWYYVLPFVLFFTRDGQLDPFLLHEHPDAERSPGQPGEQRQQLLSMIMQLSMSIGVTIAGLLLGLFRSRHAQRRQRHHTNRLYVHLA